MKKRHSKVSLVLLSILTIGTTSQAASTEELVFLQGHSIMEATLDSMMVLPGGGVVNGADLYMGFSSVAFLEADMLVHSVDRNTFSVYRDSEYFRSGILENATDFELFVHDPPKQVPISLYQYRELYGDIAIEDIVSVSGAAVFYDLRAIRAPQDDDDTGGGGDPGGGGGDTTPPVITVPGNIDQSTTDPAGTVVTFMVTADDNTDPSPDIVCVPPSGAVFPVGTTTVTCTATDNRGNSSQDSFLVGVTLLPLDPILDLSARAKSGKVSLVWTPVQDAVVYNVYRRTDGEALALIAQGVVTDYATYLDEGLTNGTTYYYRVRWLTADGRDSGDSNEASATPAARTRR